MPDTAIDELLEGLNPPQREAVTHPGGPLLCSPAPARARRACSRTASRGCCAPSRARADEILAITFTNKAAQEMRERVELLVGRATRAMWVMTFHSACARMLRAEAHRLGYTRQFTIYDAADSRRMIKKVIDDLDIDPKRFTPRAMQAQISDAKNKLRSAEDYRQMVGSYFEQTAADVYEHYERELHRANAMDFDDLLVRAVNVLELFQEVRDRYAGVFRWILVDEYQDTNHAQYRWLQLLSSEHRNLAVVGDDDQCLVEGTPITMGDGSMKPIEDVQGGRPGAVVLRQRRLPGGAGDRHASRRRRRSASRSRPRRAAASSARPSTRTSPASGTGYTPPLHMTYLMWRRDKGFRVGTTRTYDRGAAVPDAAAWPIARMQEDADAAWVLSTHDSEARRAMEEAQLSLRYGSRRCPSSRVGAGA